MDIADLAQEMRNQEDGFEAHLPRDAWLIIRLDGRGFSSLTEKYFEKPFDSIFHDLMLQTSIDLMTQLQATYVYTGSDEISLLFSPAWDQFEMRQQKIVSLSASLASVAFSMSYGKAVQFDSRVVCFSTVDEVVRYCEWRRADVQRCALQTVCYWKLRQTSLSARQVTRLLHKKGWHEKMFLLRDCFSLDFHTLPLWQQQGVGIIWSTYQKTGFDPIQQKEVVAERRRTIIIDDIIEEYGYKKWLETYLAK